MHWLTSEVISNRFWDSMIISAAFSWVYFSSMTLLKKFPLAQLLWPEASAPSAPGAELLMLNETTQRDEYSPSNSFWDTEREGGGNRSIVCCGLLSAPHAFQRFEPAKSFLQECNGAAVPAPVPGSHQSLTLPGSVPLAVPSVPPGLAGCCPGLWDWHRSRARDPPFCALGAAWAQQPFPSGSSPWTGSPQLCSLHNLQEPRAAISSLCWHWGLPGASGCCDTAAHGREEGQGLC